MVVKSEKERIEEKFKNTLVCPFDTVFLFLGIYEDSEDAYYRFMKRSGEIESWSFSLEPNFLISMLPYSEYSNLEKTFRMNLNGYPTLSRTSFGVNGVEDDLEWFKDLEPMEEFILLYERLPTEYEIYHRRLEPDRDRFNFLTPLDITRYVEKIITKISIPEEYNPCM